MQVRTTSTQRTYRYLRLSIFGAVLLIAASLIMQVGTRGALTSVSAAYYTPAQAALTGGLLAVVLALVALSGRSVEQLLLDLAAILLAVVAVVPTPIEDGDVAGLDVACPGDASCVPAAVVPAVENGVVALLVVAIVGLIAAAALALVQGAPTVRGVVGLGSAAVLVVVLAGWWFADRGSFLQGAHNAAAVGFLALVAAVAVLAAARPASVARDRHDRLRVAYVLTAVVIALAVVFLGIVVGGRAIGVDLVDASGLPLVLIGEVVALAAFGAFWVIQTIELWDEPDPALGA